MVKYLRQTPVQLLLTIFLAIIAEPYLSISAISFFLTASLLIKGCLMFFLPFVVFFYLSYALSTFQRAAPILIVLTLILIIFSNAFSVLTVYVIANLFIDQLCAPFVDGFCAHPSSVIALFPVNIKNPISTEISMITGVVVGVILGITKNSNAAEWLLKGRNIVTSVLKKVFVPLLPLYVFGFILKLGHDGDLMFLIHNYAKIFIFSVFLIIFYVFVYYLIANQFCLKQTFQSIENMVPAGVTGFSTMSSAATMPVTIECVEKNIKDSSYTQYIVPVSTNIHLIGDGLSISLTALALLYMSGYPLPNLETYLIFTFWYCVAKFSTAGVPGAGVLVILPVMQKYLYLNHEMTSILATIYILKDCLLTATNVMGNGAFAKLTHTLFKKLNLI